MARTLYLNNDFDAILRSPRDATTGAILTSATVTWRLTTSGGTELGTGSCTFDGTRDYVGQIESAAFDDQPVGSDLVLTFTLSASGVDAEWIDRKCTVRERPFEA